MLNQQTLQRLRALKLTGMADAFAQQLEQPPTQQLSFEERLALLVDRERTHRDNRRLQRLLRAAHLKQQACVEEIDYQAPRGLRWSRFDGHQCGLENKRHDHEKEIFQFISPAGQDDPTQV